jgi:hypothetical protein
MAQTDKITKDEACALAEKAVAKHGSILLAAKAWGVSVQMVHLVIKRQRRPPDLALKELGLEKVTETIIYYRKLKGKK